ncbi:MAG: hypothetical protein EPN94_03495 [Nitrospirae bacterium]|nr:MAG: hypothetical protein EPN94_03495 [Nitrospirota bacterium]
MTTTLKQSELNLETLGKTHLANLLAEALTKVEASLAKYPDDERKRKIDIQFTFVPKNDNVLITIQVKTSVPPEGLQILGAMKDQVIHIPIQEVLEFVKK